MISGVLVRRARRTGAAVMGIVAVAAIVLAPREARAESTEADSTTDVACASVTQAVPTTWYFPSTPPLGLVWLQHGFVEGKKFPFPGRGNATARLRYPGARRPIMRASPGGCCCWFCARPSM